MSIAGSEYERKGLGSFVVRVIGTEAEQEQCDTTADAARRVGFVDVEIVDVSPQNLLADGGDGGASVFSDLRTAAARLVMATALGGERVRALGAATIAAHAAAPTLVLGPGAILVRHPMALLDLAVSNGLAFGVRRLPPNIDEFEPWFASAAGGLTNWDVLAVSGPNSLLADIVERTPRAVREYDFDYARRALANLQAVVPTSSASESSVVDPAYLPDGGDIPVDAEVVTLAGFDPRRPWLPDSRLRRPRVSITDRPRLAALLREARFAGWPDVATQTAASVEDEVLRGLCVSLVLQGQLDDLPESIDSTEGLMAWLAAPSSASPDTGISNGMIVLWERRADLQAVFPRPLGPDAARYRDWAVTHGTQEGALASWVIPPAGEIVKRGISGILRRGPDLASPGSPGMRNLSVEPGVLVLGHLETRNGLGNLGRQLLADLDQFGVPTSHRVWRTGSHAKASVDREPGPPREWAVSVLGAEDGSLSRIPPAFSRARVRAGVIAWEVEGPVPGVLEYPMLYDRIWALSSFVAGLLDGQTDLPVSVMPQRAFDDSLFNVIRCVDVANPYALFVFDFFSTTTRKNPRGAIEAFTRAFGPDDGPRLVIKALNATGARSEYAEVMYAIEEHPHVELVTEVLPHDELLALMGGATAYISLHRSEGFGLTMAESMALGVPVIGTGYGGNTDFLTPDTGWVIPWEYTNVGRYGFPYPENARWAEPDVDAAAAALREVFAGGADVAARSLVGREKIRELYSLEALRTFFEREGLPMNIAGAGG